MSYAHSPNGGPARCYDHFSGFMRCMEKASHPYFCVLEREDYFECLHDARGRRRASVLALEVERVAAERIKVNEAARVVAGRGE
mmetsp:Transcript_26859/g.63019  ORF Transcript_26859/g.63019 Transcript_26859/m.63019 type:complete len:84 (+) Transcript_26859:38-289(+)